MEEKKKLYLDLSSSDTYSTSSLSLRIPGRFYNFPGAPRRVVDGLLGGNFTLDRFTIHWGESNDNGSEHSIDGKFFAAEVSV